MRSSDVIVRDPLVIAETLPRFLAVGDLSRVRFDFINTEAPAGEYTLELSIDGPLRIDDISKIQRVTIGGAGSRASVIIPVTATDMGAARIVARLTGPGDMVIDQTYALAVVPTNPMVTRRTTMELAASRRHPHLEQGPRGRHAAGHGVRRRVGRVPCRS